MNNEKHGAPKSFSTNDDTLLSYSNPVIDINQQRYFHNAYIFRNKLFQTLKSLSAEFLGKTITSMFPTEQTKRFTISWNNKFTYSNNIKAVLHDSLIFFYV